MTFIHEKTTRHYFLFLTAFCIFQLCLALGFGGMQGRMAKMLLFERERTVASALLAEGVEPEIVARALNGAQVTEEGEEFLSRIGHTQRTFEWLPVSVWETSPSFFSGILLAVIFSGILLLWITVCYLKKREDIYRSAADVVAGFADGNFIKRLPGGETGTLYQLFGAVEQLATALQAKGEKEHEAKQFLKNTISDISHQLKTPLAALNMYTEIIAEEPENKQVVREFAGKSMLSLLRMEQLIGTLLKVMRLDAGSVIFEKRICHTAELVERAVGDLLTRAEQEGKQILIEGNESDLLECDMEWTVEAVGNLVKNALDHTLSGGNIRISWQRSPVMLRLFVADDGGGIAPCDIHHIFKRFYRSRNSSDTQGTGLGLPLAKAVVEGQGGLLSVQSILNEGTAFTISFLTET